MKTNNWFEVDKAGLAKLLARKGIEFAIFELIQNAWDEDGVSNVNVEFISHSHGKAFLRVADDAPAGFADLSHAFTLFAESKKKADPEKRGRFNLGEKLVLAICDEATIISTTGTIIFDRTGRRSNRVKTERGSRLEMVIRASKADIERVNEKIKTLIVPSRILMTFNGRELAPRQPAGTVEETLATEIADAEGNLVRTKRKAFVQMFEVLPGEVGTLYEMGIPVVETGDKFHYNVYQKVPLTMDRENVPPSFLTAVRVAAFNAMHQAVDRSDINEEWVQEAVAHPNCDTEAAAHYVETKFGERRVSYDPSDPESNNRAVAAGYVVVHGGMMHKGAWDNAKAAAAIMPAGQVFPTHPGGVRPFEQAEVTDGMLEVEAYAKKLALLVLNCQISVRFGQQATREAACWGERSLQFNVRNLGVAWFDLKNNQRAIDDLIIHEFGHHYCGNHLDDGYLDALTRIGSQMVALARKGEI